MDQCFLMFCPLSVGIPDGIRLPDIFHSKVDLVRYFFARGSTLISVTHIDIWEFVFFAFKNPHNNKR